jgi:hypothetical protein
MTTDLIRGELRKSGFGNRPEPAPIQHISHARPGQRDPQQNPSLTDTGSAPNALGEPLTIREVSEMLGCSAWTIRQKYIPDGLPHLQSGPAGKLIFFRNQVVRWILRRQTNQQQP